MCNEGRSLTLSYIGKGVEYMIGILLAYMGNISCGLLSCYIYEWIKSQKNKWSLFNRNSSPVLLWWDTFYNEQEPLEVPASRGSFLWCSMIGILYLTTPLYYYLFLRLSSKSQKKSHRKPAFFAVERFTFISCFVYDFIKARIQKWDSFKQD